MTSVVRRLENASINLRLAAKRIDREIKQCGTDERRALLRVKKAIEQNDADVCALEARSAIRHRNRALQMRRTLASMRTMDENIRVAIRTRQLQQDMWCVVQALDTMKATMPMEQVQLMFERFEQHQEDMQISERALDEMTQHSNASLVPDDQVTALISQVATAHSLQLSERFSQLTKPVAVAAAAPTVASVSTASPPLAVQLDAEPVAYGNSSSSSVARAAQAAPLLQPQPVQSSAQQEIDDLETRLRRLKDVP